MYGVLARAATLTADDWLVLAGAMLQVKRVTRAQGRKPPSGENLHVHTQLGEFKYNSEQHVRVLRAPNGPLTTQP